MALGVGLIIGVIVLLIVIAIGGYIVAIFNGLIRLKNNIKKSLGNIDVLLKQRNDELPKLINTVKGYMKHEKGVLTEITKARSIYSNAGNDIHKKAKADNMLSGALKTLFAVAENYPQLKANESFLKLQDSLEGTENRIAVERKRYNEAVRIINTYIRTVFGRFFAGLAGVSAAEYYDIPEGEAATPEVKF